MKRLATLTVLLLLVGCATAVAQPHRHHFGIGRAKIVKRRPVPAAPAPRPLGVLLPAVEGMNFQAEQEAAYQVAAAYWNRPPNCYFVIRAIHLLPEGELGIGTEASSPSPLETCEMVISPKVSEGDFHMLCLVVTHEYGHLTGMPHSTDPSSVMYPTVSPKTEVPGC